MSFNDYEYSVQDGEPYELYSFVSEGAGLEYYFTTSAEAKTFGGKVYEPTHIMRTTFDVSAVIESIATVDITLPRAATPWRLDTANPFRRRRSLYAFGAGMRAKLSIRKSLSGVRIVSRLKAISLRSRLSR